MGTHGAALLAGLMLTITPASSLASDGPPQRHHRPRGVTIDTLLKLGQALDVDPVVFLRPYKDRGAAGHAGPAKDASPAEEPAARKERRRAKDRTPG